MGSAGCCPAAPSKRKPADAKASAVGPLIAWEPLGQPVWSPRRCTPSRAKAHAERDRLSLMRMIAEAAASVPLLVLRG